MGFYRGDITARALPAEREDDGNMAKLGEHGGENDR